VVIRATDTEIDLSGSPTELRNIGRSLSAIADGEVREFDADAAADPSPYDRMLSGLRVVVCGKPVRLSVSDSWLVAEGDAAGLRAFASWFDYPDDARFPAHGHFEWYPGHMFVAENSRPLVVSVAEQAQPGDAPDPGSK